MPLTTPRTTSAERAKALLQLPLRRVYPDTCTVKECVCVFTTVFFWSMSDAFPHVARRRDRIEPTGECSHDEARKRLSLLRPLLECLSKTLKRPNLLQPFAIDSIGTLLCPPVSGPIAASNPLAERYRKLLVDLPEPNTTFAYPKVRLQLRTHETISVQAAEELDTRSRLNCVAIRDTAEMARRLDPHERALSDLTIELDEKGTSIVVRQQRDALRAVVYLIPASDPKQKPKQPKTAPKRTILEARLPDDQRLVLPGLFQGAGRGRLGQLRPDPLTSLFLTPPVPKATKGTEGPTPAPGKGYHLLPTWMTEHLATLAQDLFRLHVLATAAVPQGQARMLYFDRSSVHRNDDPRFYRDKEHTLIRCPLHAASSACVCSLHSKTSTTPFRTLEFRIELCGAAFVERDGAPCCPRHCRVDAQESALFPGFCTRCLKVELWCQHDRKAATNGASGPPPPSETGIRIAMTGLIENPLDDMPKPPPGAWMKQSVREMAACAVRLASSTYAGTAGATAVLDLKADADGVMSALERECHSRGHVDARIGELDETAVWQLRMGGGRYCRRMQKIEMPNKRKLPGDPPCVAKTHGHLFRVQK